MRFDNPKAPYTEGRTTPNYKIDYFVNPVDIASYTPSKLTQLDTKAEIKLGRLLRNECDQQMMYKQRLREDAQGWFYQDPDKMAAANNYKMTSCDRLKKLKISS